MGGSSTKQAPPQTATQVTQLPAFVQPTAQRYLDRAEALSQSPFQSYQGTRISPLNTVHNFALDQARQQFMPQMAGAATQMGNFMGGAFNEPAYIHPYLGPMLPMQSYQGISRPYPVGPGGSPGGGGKGGQQPPPQYPVQPGFPSGPPDPITGTPIDPNQPTFPEIPSPTAPGPTAPVTGDGSVRLPSFVDDSGGSADENFDGSSPIGTGYDMSNFPDEDTGSFAQYAPTLGRIGGALAPIPGGYFLGGMIGDSIADTYSDETLADVFDPGYDYGDQRLGYQSEFEITPDNHQEYNNEAFTPSLGYAPNSLTSPESLAGYESAATPPAPERAATMPAPEQIEDMNYGPSLGYAPNSLTSPESLFATAPTAPTMTQTQTYTAPSTGMFSEFSQQDQNTLADLVTQGVPAEHAVSVAKSRGLLSGELEALELDATLAAPSMMGIMDALPGVSYYGSNTNPGETFADFSGFGGLGVDQSFHDPVDPDSYGDDGFGMDATGGFEF